MSKRRQKLRDSNNQQDQRNVDSRRYRQHAKTPLWKKLRGFCLLLTAIGVAEGGAAILTSPRFGIQKIQVEGTRNTSTSQVQSAASNLIGHNWIRTNSEATINAIETIPTVDRVELHRTFARPWQLGLKVVVKERKPYVAVADNGHWWVVDKKGVPYSKLTRPDDSRMYAVIDSGPSLNLGQPVPPKRWEKIDSLIQVISTEQENQPWGQDWKLRRMYIGPFNNVTLLANGKDNHELEIQLGADRWAPKLHRAQLALNYLGKTGKRVKSLNFISYKVPTWTPRTDADDATS